MKILKMEREGIKLKLESKEFEALVLFTLGFEEIDGRVIITKNLSTEVNIGTIQKVIDAFFFRIRLLESKKRNHYGSVKIAFSFLECIVFCEILERVDLAIGREAKEKDMRDVSNYLRQAQIAFLDTLDTYIKWLETCS